MRLVPPAEFRRWASDRHIWLPGDRTFDPLHHRLVSSHWPVPQSDRDCLYFAQHVLAGLGTWSRCYFWRLGQWKPTLAHEFPERMLYNAVVTSCNPSRKPGAIAFTRRERDRATALAIAATLAAGGVDDDFYVIPDHSQCWVRITHHDMASADFRTRRRAAAFARHMAAQEFMPLPDGYWTGQTGRPVSDPAEVSTTDTNL